MKGNDFQRNVSFKGLGKKSNEFCTPDIYKTTESHKLKDCNWFIPGKK